ncbi:orotidine 5'-phosphate decarboxylase / HUMPS family protein [Stygiolobus caldivivus]|uniref:3-hexulose-6-phosphate synthase n=1 Tax=Stygiolobus caldivivus TaxID=2824673 RepID=A0A8D5U7X5_9CREN|nr:orotidine 5'-phosphate decarboxylase / HUMPS family protein [Stygiolobus caldivivus]BCU70404.1 3-hexulose-6-phosphate synthase [Stygiolobus caldivivus]
MELLKTLNNSRLLQVALDFLKIDDAEKVAIETVRAGADIIECGTPLLKAEGINALRRLNQVSNGKIVLADTKTADAGDVEAEIANLGGAKIMTVLGIMDDATIESAVRKAHEYGILVQADLINVKNVRERAKELKDLGVDIIGLHVGLDVQKKRGISVSDLKKEIKEVSELGVLVSVAGGLNRERVEELLDLPINIFVVGGAITKSKNPYDVTAEIVKVIKQK